MFAESWLLNPLLTKTIISLDPICKHNNAGKLPEDVAEECEKLWSQLFSDKNDVSPLIKTYKEMNANRVAKGL